MKLVGITPSLATYYLKIKKLYPRDAAKGINAGSISYQQLSHSDRLILPQ